jgi:hypothetical protein
MQQQHDYKAASTRYMCMRAEGELAHLSERTFLDNLHAIGLFWHGPPHPLAKNLPGGFAVDEHGDAFSGRHKSGWTGPRRVTYGEAVDDCVGFDHESRASESDRDHAWMTA